MSLAEQYTELQEKYPRVDVEKVLHRFREVKRRAPTSTELEFWVANEKNPANLRQQTERVLTSPSFGPAPDCRQCDGTGFVKSARKYNDHLSAGRLFSSYFDPHGKALRKLVRCDHLTVYIDPKHGQEAEQFIGRD